MTSRTEPRSNTPARFKSGTGVWLSRPSKDGTVLHTACHISAWNSIAGCYYVVFDTDPLKGAFAPAWQIRERFVGEIAPGVMGAVA